MLFPCMKTLFYFLLDSGLMIASKYPFMEVHFHKFKSQGRKLMLRLFDYGCIMVKLNLGMDKVKC